MKNQFKLYALVLLATLNIYSQDNIPYFKDYSWVENPKYSINDHEDESIVSLKSKIVTEFLFEGDNLVEYFLEHKIIWLNADDKIEDYNKVYLPYSSTSNLEMNKARVITKEGAVIELDESKILTAEDEETKKQYKYFAFEGIEKGSFIEYFYVVKRKPKYSGRKISLQSTHLKQNVEFDLFAPKNLIFKFKTYNDSTTVILDTLVKDRKHWSFNLKEVEILDRENLSAYGASKKYLIYKLDENLANNASDISSYGKVSQNLYNFYYPDYSKKTQNQIIKFLKDAELDVDQDAESLIRKMESYIKTNIFESDGGNEDLGNLNAILNQKIASESGLIKLYIALFRKLKIKHELVITTDRQTTKFDKNFEAHNFLTDFLFYFPKTKTYVSPIDDGSRYGFPPAYLTDNFGLFIKEVSIGNFKSGIGKIKYIKPIDAENSFDKMILDVKFNSDDLTMNTIHLKRSLSGYYAMYLQPYMHLIKGDDRDKIIDEFAKALNESVEIINKKLVNDSPDLFGIKPFQIIIDLESEAFVEKAGNKYLFKLGELIGQQMEMYQDKKRHLPIENEFQRSYYRTLNITIPNGYKIANLEDLNIKNSLKRDGVELLSFHSFYEINGDILTITADEHYRINILDASDYEAFRNVINSAADFNKITLIMEPI